MKRAFLPLAGLLLLPAPAARAQSGLLQSLAKPQDYQALRVSSYDRTGGNRDAIPVPPGKTALLADLQGPGAITHIWFTISSREKGHLRKLILRAWWDGEKNPSIECPIGDFFGCHHARAARFSSLPIAIGSRRALNCFWYMPFSKSARFTLENLGKLPVRSLYYYIDYRKLSAPPASPMRFHAQFRCAFPCKGGDYTILEAKGRGHYVGVTMGIRLRRKGWWGEGDDKFYIDGRKYTSLHGTGSEDYFCGAWGFGETFSAPFFGLPLRPEGHPKGGLWTVYRFHPADPVPFQSSIRVTIEHGAGNNRSDDFTTVAYWYQEEPHAPFPTLPPADKLFPPPLEPAQKAPAKGRK